MSKAQAAEVAAKGKLIYTVTLSNDKVHFPVNKAQISDEAKAMIDETVAPLVQANRGVYFEIEGHTDNTGDAAYNFKLGEERALAVRDYIAKTQLVGLNRLSRDLVRRGQAGGRQQDPRGPAAEPPRRDPDPRVAARAATRLE